MSKIENLKKVQQILQNITRGQHPYTGAVIQPNEVCADERVIQWFNFLEEEIGSSIERLEKHRAGMHERFVESAIYTAFKISKEQLAKFQLSESPITISEITKRLNELSNCPPFEELKPMSVNLWLIADGLLQDEETPYGKMKNVTEQGKKLGIKSEEKTFQDRKYLSITYNLDAQRYILNNVPEYLKRYSKSSKEA